MGSSFCYYLYSLLPQIPYGLDSSLGGYVDNVDRHVQLPCNLSHISDGLGFSFRWSQVRMVLWPELAFPVFADLCDDGVILRVDAYQDSQLLGS